MDLSVLWKILVVLGFVLLNGFFVAAEFALVKVRPTQLAPLVRRGHRGAKVAQRVVERLDLSLSACQLGVTLASLGLGWFGEPIFGSLLRPLLDALSIQSEQARESIAFFIGFTLLTYLHIVAGEQAPKWLAIQKPAASAARVARPLAGFAAVSYPFIWLLNRSALALLRSLGIEPANAAEAVHSEEELRLLVAMAQQQMGGPSLGKQIVLNAFDLRRRIAREVMRPRQEIAFFDTGSSITECLDLAEKSRYSRYPLCDNGDLDKTLGVVHLKDLYAMRLKIRRAAELAPAARKLIYVPETASLETVLRLCLERRLHFAIVVDEYGATVGMLTLENILEELVGQIQDEFDQEKPLARRLEEGVWEISGALPLHELSDILGLNLAEEGITTTSGWVTQQLGGFPKVGSVIALDGFELRVEELAGLRVSKLRLTRVTKPIIP